jgi:V-type H+-transporting ATPase subunit H
MFLLKTNELAYEFAKN